jgi:hypothetical protein
MADINLNYSVAVKKRNGATPVSQPNAGGVEQNPVNPFPSDAVGNFVTIDTDQTITGAKTFDNPLLIQSGSNPVMRIKTTDNTATVNFRNVFNEDQAGIELNTPSNKLSIVTRTANTDIEINPNGTGSILLPNVASGTPVSNLGIDVDNKLVKISGSVVESVSGTAVDNTDPSNPIVSVDDWVFVNEIDTITLNDTNSNVTYTCNSTLTTYTNSKLQVKNLYLRIYNIASSGSPSGGNFEIKGFNFYSFISANDNSVLYELKTFQGTSYAESLVALLRPTALGTVDGQLVFRKVSSPTQQAPFTSTNGEIVIKIAILNEFNF